jgi:hypothetical protein
VKRSSAEEQSRTSRNRTPYLLLRCSDIAVIESNDLRQLRLGLGSSQLVEIDFFGDAPALLNEFKVWLTSGFFEGSTVADAPDWIRTQDGLRGISERVSSDALLVVCRAGNGQVNIPVLNSTSTTGYALLSDEAVESIGSEDYNRMVVCLGQGTTDKFFREKMSGLV